MHVLAQFRNVSEADKAKAVEKLITDSTSDFDFYLLITLSFLMATFGLLISSPAIVIGSMLIAPILYPLLSLALGLVLSDLALIGRSLRTTAISLVLGIAVAAGTTLVFGVQDAQLTEEVLRRTDPSILYFAVAIIAGIAVAYSLVDGKLSETLPGVAVSVALLPPLAVVGVGAAALAWNVVTGALTLFLINAAGIIFAGMLSFSIMDLYGKRSVARKTMEKEEERIEQDQKQAQADAEGETDVSDEEQ